MQDDQQQFDALCFLHACGKTSADEAAWMNAMMARHPHWRARFDQERLLVTEARAAESERQLAALPLVSFDQVLAALADGEVPAPQQTALPQAASQPAVSSAAQPTVVPAIEPLASPVAQQSAPPVTQSATQPATQSAMPPETQPATRQAPATQPATQQAPATQPATQRAARSLLARVQAWWRRPLPGGLAYGVMAVLVAGVSVQSWRLEQVGAPDVEAARYRGQAGASTGAAATAQLKVVFDDRASAGAIRLALHRLGLSIVHGPDAQGAYLLSAGQGDAVQAAQQLQATGLVLDALPLPASQAQSPQ